MLSQQNIITPQNRSFRYGDGVFETIKVFRGDILLADYHFDRLFQSLAFLKIDCTDNFLKDILSKKILELCRLNKCQASARVRLAVYRKEEGKTGFVIETFSLDEKVNSLNKEGWTIDIYPLARKSCDAFANLKSANYLPYVMADLYAKEKNCNEAIVLNVENNLCDASKANIFLLAKEQVYTPALHQGCVNGVKRRFVIEELKKQGIVVHQKAITEQMLFDADEVFLTNAIYDVRWVESFRSKNYGNKFVTEFYAAVFLPIYK